MRSQGPRRGEALPPVLECPRTPPQSRPGNTGDTGAREDAHRRSNAATGLPKACLYAPRSLTRGESYSLPDSARWSECGITSGSVNSVHAFPAKAGIQSHQKRARQRTISNTTPTRCPPPARGTRGQFVGCIKDAPRPKPPPPSSFLRKQEARDGRRRCTSPLGSRSPLRCGGNDELEFQTADLVRTSARCPGCLLSSLPLEGAGRMQTRRG